MIPHIHIRGLVFFTVILSLTFGFNPRALSQESGSSRQLDRVEVEPPVQSVTSRGGDSGQGFGYDTPIPGGQERSDFPLTSSQVVSPTGRVANIATVPSAISVVTSQGVTGQGNTGVSDMVKGVPGVNTGTSKSNMFGSAIKMRGFDGATDSANRVAIMFEGRNQELPLSEINPGFIFPEIIDRIEVMRGDGTIQFGNKAIGGSLNILLKKPRQNPGIYWGTERGSWETERHWVSANLVRGPIAAGVFGGFYSENGFRRYEGEIEPASINGLPTGYSVEEVMPRPGPWELYNVVTSANWKITPRLSLDFTYLFSRECMPNAGTVPVDRWERRDTRNVDKGYADGGTDDRFDKNAVLRMYYDGGNFGSLEANASQRYYDVRSNAYLFTSSKEVAYRHWADQQLSFKYLRTDKYDFIRNDLTLGSDLRDGLFTVERKQITGTGTAASLRHKTRQGTHRESLGYYVMNQTRLWDRLIFGLAYRYENYEFNGIYADGLNTKTLKIAVFPQSGLRMGWVKSASQYSLNVVYDKELGSNFYGKHARTYRFPIVGDVINNSSFLSPGTSAHPDPVWFVDPEEGTLEEVGIRHWFTPNIYVGLIYYELDMDNEIGQEYDLRYAATRWTTNIPLVSHDGLEAEWMIRFTPRWQFDGSFTKQKVIYRSANLQPGNFREGRKADAWEPPSPAQMYYLRLTYDNKEWGFASSLSYFNVSKAYYQGDDLNAGKDMEETKQLDLAVAQSFFSDMITVYGGITNITDRTNMPQSSYSWSSGAYPTYSQYPDKPRTYYGGIKAKMDYDRMKVPTVADFQRMQERLYGAFEDGVGSLAAMPGRIRGFLPF
jgi:iron complex outermembrane recepter protein